MNGIIPTGPTPMGEIQNIVTEYSNAFRNRDSAVTSLDAPVMELPLSIEPEEMSIGSYSDVWGNIEKSPLPERGQRWGEALYEDASILSEDKSAMDAIKASKPAEFGLLTRSLAYKILTEVGYQ